MLGPWMSTGNLRRWTAPACIVSVGILGDMRPWMSL